ncbi:PREDICTED: chondroitin sulfate synthase 1-like [Priapulus caudatus]|uniref:Hexosyltransferase n=1 Tax=Priapulus caudatus TaxID=37621 RepID=A0ABM1EI45_PRICU|nr:PREDICTED: chondroitin sulfate synthase 1-like [Priapulus caudatus]
MARVSSSIYTALSLLVGIFIGFSIATWLRAHLRICQKQEEILPKPPPNFDDLPPDKRLLFVGIMTAQKFLDTRALTVYQTWGQTIPGKLAFFSSQNSVSKYDIPIVPLERVTDHYPPQKKSFMMLKFMYDNYIDKFEWFMRADDDVYIKADVMEKFLRSVNSSTPLFMGQSGMGKKEELGQLGISSYENFCMGGPGMIFSRETLRRIAPHIQYCLTHLYSFHEDVEIGRCVRQFANISCTWNYEMLHILYHNTSSKADEKLSYIGNLYKDYVLRATSLHPFKVTPHMYRAHAFFDALHARDLRHATLQLTRDASDMDALLGDRRTDRGRLALHPGLSRAPPAGKYDTVAYDFISRSLYSEKNSNPKRGPETATRDALESVVMALMRDANAASRERGRVIDFKEVLYGYVGVDPPRGATWVVDVLMTYKKYAGRKMTVPVRRHVYLQQAFTDVQFREETREDGAEASEGATVSNAYKTLQESLGVGLNLAGGLGGGGGDAENGHEDWVRAKVVHFILPLAGRFATFQRFMNNFESVCLRNDEAVKLAVILFEHAADDAIGDTVALVGELRGRYPHHELAVVHAKGPFSRAPALEIGARQYGRDALLFFVDVDMHFDAAFLQRVRLNTVQSRSVYFPIVYSQFDPATVYADDAAPRDPLRVAEHTGYWRQFGFGIASMYHSDLRDAGGFDLSIVGWGKEDVDLFDKMVRGGNVTIHRAADPGIVHVYHRIECDAGLEPAQLAMCRGTRASTYGSQATLAATLYASPHLLDPVAAVPPAGDSEKA